MDCNIPKAVDKLIHPEEPLALRLTSNLMFGVTRIYSYQCNYLHQHATTTSTSLKQAVVKLDIPRSHKDALATLTLTNEAVATSGNNKGNTANGASKSVRDGGLRITMTRDEGIDLLADFGDMFNGRMDYTWEQLREELNTTTSAGKRKRSSSSVLEGDGSFIDELDPLDGDEYVEQGANKKVKKEKAAKESGPVGSRRNTTVGRLEDINLPAHLMDGQHMGDALNDDQLIFGEDREFDPMFDLDPDFDLGLADLPPPLADLDDNVSRVGPRTSNLTVAGELNAFENGGISGGPDTSATGFGGFEFGLDGDDPFTNNADFELGLDGFDNGLYEGLDNIDARNGNVSDARDHVVHEDKIPDRNGEEALGPPTPPPSDGLLQEHLNANNAQEINEERDKTKLTTRKPRSKKLQQTIKDKFITLHSDEITKNREAYSDEMKKFNLRKDLERFEKVQRESVLEKMTSLPMGIKAPAFEKFFSEALNLNDLLRLPGKTKKAPVKNANNKHKSNSLKDPSLPDEDRSMTTYARGGIREGSVMSSQIGRNGYRNDQQSDFDFGDGFELNLDNGDHLFAGAQGGDFQYDAFQNDHARGDWQNDYEKPPSVARSFSIGPRGERGSSMHAEESNVGRDRAASLSYDHGSQMPWNTSYSSAAGFGNAPSSSARYSMGRGSVPPTPGGPRSRSSSVLGNSFLRGRTAFRADSPFQGDNLSLYERGQTPSRAETPGKYRESPAPSVSIGEGRYRESSCAIPEHVFSDGQIGETESQIEIRLESESRNFYRYAKGFAQAPSNQFLLSDIIPVAPTAPIVAAQAFYHMLMLASKGLFKVHQQEAAYGEIRLSIPNATHSSQSQSPAIAV